MKYRESEITELKKSTSEIKEAIISMSAMLNKHNRGEVYFGIRNNGSVAGRMRNGNVPCAGRVVYGC